MAIITFMSDYGWKDHYVASVKAAIMASNQNVNIVDISHDIDPFDIAHGAHVLGNAYAHFPSGSVHLVCIDPIRTEPSKYIAVALDDHFFVAADSGLLSLISEKSIEEIVELAVDQNDPFPEKNVLAKIVSALAAGKALKELGSPVQEIFRVFNRTLKATKREIVGHVMHVDGYGNLITNIAEKDYRAIQKINGEVPIQVQVGRDVFRKFHENFSEVESGHCFLIFNSQGVLQIGINKGNAAELLGLRKDTPITITFQL